MAPVTTSGSKAFAKPKPRSTQRLAAVRPASPLPSNSPPAWARCSGERFGSGFRFLPKLCRRRSTKTSPCWGGPRVRGAAPRCRLGAWRRWRSWRHGRRLARRCEEERGDARSRGVSSVRPVWSVKVRRRVGVAPFWGEGEFRECRRRGSRWA